MASNAVTIQITGDESDLKKALQRAAQDIENTAKRAKKAGDESGGAFGSSFASGARAQLRLVTEGFKEISTTAEGGFASIGASFISKVFNPVTLALASIGASVYAAFKFSLIGEENAKIEKNFKRFAEDAGLDADRLRARIAGIAEGFVGLSDILPRAGESIIALGKNASRLPEILELARNIGVTTGRDVKEVFDELTKGIENQNVKLLRNNLIRLDGTKVLADYASANKGNAESLTEAAKQQAFLNATLEQGKKKFGEVGAQATPIKGGIQQLKLAFEDLRDAIAAIVNSGVGSFFADIISGAAKATKAVANIFTKEGAEGPDSLNAKIEETKQKITDLVNLKLSIPYGFDEKLLEQTTQKLKDLYKLQDDRKKAQETEGKLNQGDIFNAETSEQYRVRIEKEQQAQAELAALKAEGRAVELQAETDHQIALATIAADGDANAQIVRDARFEAQIQRNMAEYESAVAKAQKIKDLEQRAAAEDIARQKMVAANQKAVDAEEVLYAKAAADAKLAIENNLFKAALMLADQQTALGKGLAVAQAVRQTYLAATAALAPPPVGAGPLFGPALAASTVALGLAQVAKIVAANNGALVTGGQTGVDNQPFLLSKGEIVAPAKSFDEVVEGTARQRGYTKNGDAGETNSLLRELISKIDAKSISVTVNTDVIADENGINALVTRIRDAIDFNAAPSLG